MRRFGIHGIVALAGLVACGRFGSGEESTPEPPDASSPTSPDGGGKIGTVGGAPESGTTSGPRFCEQYKTAYLCADFEDGEPKTPLTPAGASGFTHTVATAPGGRKALKLTAKDVTASWGRPEAAFAVPIDVPSLKAAKVDLEIMCETIDIDFVRTAGFLFEAKARTLTLDIFGHDKEFAVSDKRAPIVPGTWTHAKMELKHAGDDLQVTSYVVGDTPMGTPKMDVHEKEMLLFGIGAWDISTSSTRDLVVWMDDVVLTVE